MKNKQKSTDQAHSAPAGWLRRLVRRNYNEVSVAFEELPTGSFGIIEDDHDLFEPGFKMDATLHVVIKNGVLLRLAKWFFGDRYESRGVSFSGKCVTGGFSHGYMRLPNDQGQARRDKDS